MTKIYVDEGGEGGEGGEGEEKLKSSTAENLVPIPRFKMAAATMACSRMCFSSSFGARFALSSIRVNQGII